MICLKNRTFAVSQTTGREKGQAIRQLWFAWKIVLLQYRKQPPSTFAVSGWVVICLKNRTFAVSQTTERLSKETWTSCDLLEKSYFCSIANNSEKTSYCDVQLWFAWKIVLLQYRKQPLRHFVPHYAVVICLKNRTFAVSQTTDRKVKTVHKKLWFAWKIVLLQYRKQPIW